VVARGAGGRALSSARRGRLSRRDFLRLSGASLAGAALLGTAGCGGGGGETGGVTNIVFSFGPDDSGTLTEVVNRFNEEYQGEIQAEYRKMPSDTGTYFNQIRTEFQSGASPIDVIGGDVIWPAQLAANGWILDLSDLFTEDMRSDFVDAAVDSVTYQGKVWGVPWFTDAGLLWYRKDLVEESGFSEGPQTWDELKEMALKTSQDSGTEFGFIFQGAQYEGAVVDGLEYIWSSDGDVLTNSGEVVVDQPDTITGLRTQRSMIEDGVSPIAVVNYKEPETHTAFLNGSAVFCRNWPYMYGLAGNPDMSKIEPEQVGVSPLPVGEGQGQTASCLGGWNMLINASSEMQDEAWDFVQFMTSEASQKAYTLSASTLPTFNALYNDREILEEVPVIALSSKALQNARPRPISPYYSEMSRQMAEQFNNVLRGAISPEVAVETLQGELQRIIQQG
jgi:multiple sugar transport system substrate-binding protein